MLKDTNTAAVLKQLENAGYEAYIVGGCVRDMLLGRAIHDTDITTNALPEQIISAFPDCKIIPTGIKHGTVTIIKNHIPYEITTYRIDGEYTDSRRPDTVEFTADITDDLSRRDFTMNAIAMDRHGALVDAFGGKNDIENKLIRCVGEPELRFTEDALRIMRAIRFSSQLGFAIEKNTAEAVHRMKDRLKNISRERVRDELDKLLCGKNCLDVLMEYSDVIATIIPEFQASIGFEQHTPYHRYDVWEHTVRAVANAPADNLNMRRALLFHDIAKPYCAEFDSDGRGHFKHHNRMSAEMTEKIMKDLRYDNDSIKYAVTLIAHHDDKFFHRYDIKKAMSEMGDDLFFELMEIKKYDNSSKSEFVLDELNEFDKLIALGHEIIENNECRSLKQLAVNGSDLMSIGLSGKEIGDTFSKMLDLVMKEKLTNDKNTLMDYAKQRCQK